MAKKIYHINNKNLSEAFDFEDDDNPNAEIDEIKNHIDFLKKKESIKAFLDFYAVENYEITPQGIIVNGNVDLSSKKLKMLPYKFKKVSGNFNIAFNNISSLNNIPEIVTGNFNCNFNNIRSFEGAPIMLSGKFYGDKQNYGKNIKLSNEFYKEWINNIGISEGAEFASKVKLLETNQFGDLQSIDESLETCSILLEDGTLVTEIPTNKVEVLENIENILK